MLVRRLRTKVARFGYRLITRLPRIRMILEWLTLQTKSFLAVDLNDVLKLQVRATKLAQIPATGPRAKSITLVLRRVSFNSDVPEQAERNVSWI